MAGSSDPAIVFFGLTLLWTECGFGSPGVRQVLTAVRQVLIVVRQYLTLVR
jgi:hypothetical protein